MSRKTRKLIWSAPLLAVLAVAAALAMFAAQTPIGAQAQDAEETLGPPLELTAEPDGRKVIALEWMPPATSPEDVTAYRVDKSEDGKVWMREVPASAGLQDVFYDHTGLMPGDTMYYRVFAIYGSKGEGEPSETASATTVAATAPGKPEFSDPAFGTATSSDVSGLAPSWAAPSDDGGSPITGYKIERLKEGDNTWMTVKADTGLTTNEVGADCAAGTACVYQDTGLIQATKYHYRVSAINKVGTGMASDSESSTTAASTTGAAAPTGLTAQGSNAAVTLHWLAPSDPSGDPITGYKVERSADSTALTENPWVVIPTTGTRTSHFVGGAFSSGEELWHYRVTAVNAGGGDGLQTAALTVGPPKASTHGPAQSLRVRSEKPLTINVSWREASGSATVPGTTTYRVDYSKDGQVWRAAATPYPTTADETSERFIYRDAGLKIGEMRYYRVIADTGGTLHQVTNVVSGTAGPPNKPGKPTDLEFTTTPPTANTITVGWTAPTETGGSPITGYKIERSQDAATGWTTIKANTGNTDVSYMDKNLPANTQYHYRVSAMNAGQTGDASDSADTKTAPAQALGLPTGLVALDRGTSVDLYWLSPGDADGAPVTGYKIEVSEDGGTTWTTLDMNTMSRETMYTHTGLTKLTGDATRMYRVTAISSVGPSAPSMSDTAGPGGMVNADPMVGAAIGAQSIEVGEEVTFDLADHFSDADGDTLTYAATVMPADGSIATARIAVDDSDPGTPVHRLTITGVAAGSATVTVTASDGMGGEDAMQTIRVTVESTELTAPSSVMADHEGLVVTVTWGGGENADTFAVALIRRDAEGNWDIDNAVYDTGVTGSPHTVNMVNRPAGTYHVFVTAGSAEQGWTAWVAGSLAYAP